MKEKQKKSITSNLLVAAGQSKRLAAMRHKVQASTNMSQQQILVDLKPETKEVHQQAKEFIEQEMSSILNAYPAGKKNTFFKLKYGVDVDNIKSMAMKNLFVVLKLQPGKIRQFRLIENLDLNGNTVND